MRGIVLLFVVLVVYAVVRYVAFMPHNAPNIPVFILNKSVSMGAALCFAAAFWQQWRRERGRAGGAEPGTWFRAGVVAVVVHIPMSLTLLRPAYFKEFFAGDGRFSFNGEMVLLLGALAAAGVFLMQRMTWTTTQRWWLSLGTMIGLFGHTLAMGLARGLNINRSHAYLPPMWLLSLVGITLGLLFVLRTRPRTGATAPLATVRPTARPKPAAEPVTADTP